MGVQHLHKFQHSVLFVIGQNKQISASKGQGVFSRKCVFRAATQCALFFYFFDYQNVNSESPFAFYFQGLVDALCKACEQLKWKAPSKIQRESIPVALQGKDIIGLAETGSGKTAAFALPILQALLENPQRHFALILTPTRELAFQISEQFEALGELFIILFSELFL